MEGLLAFEISGILPEARVQPASSSPDKKEPHVRVCSNRDNLNITKLNIAARILQYRKALRFKGSYKQQLAS